MSGLALDPAQGAIPFTQFLMPDGRRQEITWETDDTALLAKAERILAAGLKFEIEMLSDYSTISATISDPIKGEDVFHKMCANGPAVTEMVPALIMEFDLEGFASGKRGTRNVVDR